ncbi:MAG TPA: ATP-binding protein [Pyrinomonadaceae bacterium]|jgi:PAS domain S-box-containing protein|nr:ATP-binding protein [Pyrinomonadaceae bacterium]
MTKVRERSTAEDAEISELKQRLEEAEETLRAIREGEVDALVVDGPRGEVIYTMTSADYPYRLMIDEMNEGAVSVSPDAFILYSNRNFASILGLNGSNTSGVPFGDFIVPEMRERFLHDLQQARERSIRREYTLTPGNGREVPVLMSFAKLQPQTNSISIVVTDLTAQKALEEKLRQAKNGLEEQVADRTKELRDSEARLFGILEHSAADLKAMRRLNEIGTLCAKEGDDIDGCLRDVLHVAIEISGADKGNVQLLDHPSGVLRLAAQSGFDESFLEFFKSVRGGDTACGVALHTKQRVTVEDVTKSEIYAGRPSLDAMREADVMAVQSLPLLSSTGNVLGIISVHSTEVHRASEQELRLMDLLARQTADYLERKRVEKEREHLLDREHELRQTAEEANRLKDEFLAIMSHELRNPLNVILGYAELLLRMDEIKESPNLHRMADAVKRNAVAQSKLIRDLLDLSRLRSGKLELNRETVSPSVSIENAIETVRIDADAKGIEISVAAPDEMLFVQADPVRLEQIIWNLLNNSVKFTPRGGRIKVNLEEADDDVVLTVSDSGQGIDASFLPHIFEIFRQADSRTNRSQQGMGIGLAVVQQLVELHGGSVTAYSAGTGKGATFEIRLPRSVDTKRPPAPVFNLGNGSLSGLEVLVVDDSEDTTEMVQHLLETGGASVCAVTSGAEALRVAREREFDVVLSDISMPEMDGFQFLSELRKLPGKSDLPAVALTGFGRPEDVRRATEEGFYAHLTKPFDFQTLARLLQKMPRHKSIGNSKGQ